MTQTESLGDRHVNVKVTRTAERVSTDAGQLESHWRVDAEAIILGRVYNSGSVSDNTTRRVTAGDERIVGSVCPDAPLGKYRPHWTKARAARADALADHRGPGKACMRSKD